MAIPVRLRWLGPAERTVGLHMKCMTNPRSSRGLNWLPINLESCMALLQGPACPTLPLPRLDALAASGRRSVRTRRRRPHSHLPLSSDARASKRRSRYRRCWAPSVASGFRRARPRPGRPRTSTTTRVATAVTFPCPHHLHPHSTKCSAPFLDARPLNDRARLRQLTICAVPSHLRAKVPAHRMGVCSTA